MYSLEQSLISLPSASLKAFVDRYSVLQCITCSPWGWGGGGGGGGGGGAGGGGVGGGAGVLD